MKKLLAVFTLLVAMTIVTFAQDVNPNRQSGSKSLDFTFNGLGAFGIGPAGVNNGLGLSYFLSNDASARIGFQIALPSKTTPANPAVGKTGTDATASAFSFGVGADYLMHTGTGRVRPYMGAGVRFGMTSTNDKDGTNDNTGFTQTETKNRNGGVNIGGTNYSGGTNLGLMGIVGAEFFLYNELSLSAEYNLNIFSMTSASDEVATKGSTSVTTKSASFSNILGFGCAGAILHIYF